MRVVSYQPLNSAKPFYVIDECDGSDTCPACGAGYRVGLSACEYCKNPVQVLHIPQPQPTVR